MLRISAPHFVAGVIIENGVVTEAAPILYWTRGKTDTFVKNYCEKKNWKYEVL